MSFQEKLRYYREKAGYKSAKEFARLLGVPYTTYVAYENKDREPRYKTLCKIAQLLNVTPNDLLEFAEKDEIYKYIDVCNTSRNKAELMLCHGKPYIKLTLQTENSSSPNYSLSCTADEFSQIVKNALSDPYYEKQKNDMDNHLKSALNLAINKSALKYIISTRKEPFSEKALSVIKEFLKLI